MKTNHLYRVSIYLGKERHKELSEMAKDFRMPLSTLVRMCLEMGMKLADKWEEETLNG